MCWCVFVNVCVIVVMVDGGDVMCDVDVDVLLLLFWL